MDVDINLIKANLRSVFSNLNLTNFSNYYLVTFITEEVSSVQEYSTPEGLVASLNVVSASGGDNNCPENSPKATERALVVSEPGSHIFVFTNAFAKEYGRMEEIKELCLSKQSKVTIFLSGSCGPNIGNVDILYDIARYCSGMVVKLYFGELKQAFPLMREMIKDDWDIDVKQLGQEQSRDSWSGLIDTAKYRQEFPLSVNAVTSDVILAISGDHPTLNVMDPQGRSPALEDIARSTHLLVKRITNPVIGMYRIEASSQGKTSMAVFSKKQFPFVIGFSMIRPCSIEETSERPMPAHSNYIFVYVQDAQQIELYNVELVVLSTNERKILSVMKADGYGAYYTNSTHVFQPYDRFVLNLNAYATETKERISERSPFMTPQEVRNASGTFASKPRIIQPHSTLIPYRSNVRLACKVHAYPEPVMTWEADGGVTLKTHETLLLEMPSTHLTYTEIENIQNNVTVTCRARNFVGDNSVSVDLFVHREYTFDVIQRPKDQTVPYGREHTLHCEINSYPEATIKWLHNNTYLENSGNIKINLDDGSVTIKRMGLEEAGRYVCEASNGILSKELSADIDVSGLESPKVELQQTEIKSKPGDSIQVECRIEKGTPEPNIAWQFKSFEAYEFGPLSDGVEIEDGNLRIVDLKPKQKGTYRCTATNIMGEDFKDVAIKIEYGPIVRSDVTNIVIKEDDLVEMRCEVDAEPAASVRWELCQDDVIIPFDDRHTTDSHHTHRFIALMKDAGNYLCIAENAVGKSELTISLEVHEPPFIQTPEPKNHTVKVGTSLRLPCNVIKGHPTPTVRWTFTAADSAPKALPRSNRDSTTLVLENITKHNEGTYMCTATNIVENDSVHIYVTVIQ